MLRNIFLIATSAVGISALATRPDASTFQDSFKVWIRDQTGSNSSSYFARVFEGAVGWASSEFFYQGSAMSRSQITDCFHWRL